MSTDAFQPDRPRPADRRTRGFTVVEMLVTLAIIIVMVSVLIVGLSRASGVAQTAKTRFLMNSIATAMAQFKSDHGYLPPILGEVAPASTYGANPGWMRDALRPSSNWGSGMSGQELEALQSWFSVTSAPEYLIGYGNRSADGYGVVLESDGEVPTTPPGVNELPQLGIRAPGDDGLWGALFNPRPGYESSPLYLGTFFARNPGGAVSSQAGQGTHFPPQVQDNAFLIRGRVFGPYLELKDPRAFGALRPDGVVVMPEDPDYDSLPKVLLDHWGEPIRYYRRPYLADDPRVDNPEVGLGDVFALRPWEVPPGVASDGAADADGDTTTLPGLKSAGYALLSTGPDRRVDPTRRVDENEYNKDNIVEIGQ